ncbi:hypothetical protein, partial [Dickeya zeae]|uniref:hypothetical protein n=1 Tax=Dickeya zeae TaxID=204042 RepID=UPI001EE681B7
MLVLVGMIFSRETEDVERYKKQGETQGVKPHNFARLEPERRFSPAQHRVRMKRQSEQSRKVIHLAVVGRAG